MHSFVFIWLCIGVYQVLQSLIPVKLDYGGYVNVHRPDHDNDAGACGRGDDSEVDGVLLLLLLLLLVLVLEVGEADRDGDGGEHLVIAAYFLLGVLSFIFIISLGLLSEGSPAPIVHYQHPVQLLPQSSSETGAASQLAPDIQTT